MKRDDYEYRVQPRGPGFAVYNRRGSKISSHSSYEEALETAKWMNEELTKKKEETK